MLPAVVAAVKECGRNVSSSDMGHFKHNWFSEKGVMESGNFQFGSGREIPVAAASGLLVRSRVLAALRRGATTFLSAGFSAADVERKIGPLLADQPAT